MVSRDSSGWHMGMSDSPGCAWSCAKALRGPEHYMTQQAAEEWDGLQKRLAQSTTASEQ